MSDSKGGTAGCLTGIGGLAILLRACSSAEHGAVPLMRILSHTHDEVAASKLERSTQKIAESFHNARDGRPGSAYGQPDRPPMGSQHGRLETDADYLHTVGRAADKEDDLSKLDKNWQPLTGEVVRIEKIIADTAPELVREITSVRVISIIPEGDKAIANVFRAPPSISEIWNLRSAADNFRGMPGGTILGSQSEGEVALRALIQNSAENQCIVVVGHSEAANNTRKLVLPNGDEVKIDELQEFAISHKKPLVVLTCYSDDFGLTTEITLNEAYKMCESGQQMVLKSNGYAIQTEEVIRTMRGTMVELRMKKVAIVASTVTVTGGIAIVHARSNEGSN